MSWNDFKIAAQLGKPDHVPVAFIVDSPWLPGFAGIDTRDYFIYPDKWLDINNSLLERFPDAVWLPGYWVEYGMAAEPSAFGCKLMFHHDSPPSVEPVVEDFGHWVRHIKRTNPKTDGLMPLVIRQYEVLDEKLRAEGRGVKMVCCRGPLAVASWLAGITPLMMAMAMQPDDVHRVLDVVTDSLINWLEAQLSVLHAPEGIMVLDDLVGMVSADHYRDLVDPYMKRIFGAFDGLVRVYHNDTPCFHLYPQLADVGFDVFNFSHKVDMAEAKAAMGDRVALLGNVAPLDLGARGTPEEVYAEAKTCLDKGAKDGGMILSFGGGVSMNTPAENIDAMLRAAQDWAP